MEVAYASTTHVLTESREDFFVLEDVSLGARHRGLVINLRKASEDISFGSRHRLGKIPLLRRTKMPGGE
jgi:hypothetical protein